MIDCFTFFNELDLLEIRLNSLAPYVERFVLSEMPVTHSGNPKPLYFMENRDRFKDFPITHLVVDNYERFIGKNPWMLEKYQREYLIKGIYDENPECIILISDIDEIPNMDKVKEKGTFIQELYYYYMNTYTGSVCSGTVSVKKRNIVSIDKVRGKRTKNYLRIADGGWHFSTLFHNGVINKIESFAHQEFNTPSIKDRIHNRVESLTDPYGRTENRFKVKMPSGPKWLLENKDRYPHLFYREPDDSIRA